MAIKSFDRNIFGRKIDTPKKTVRTLPDPTAVTAMNEIAVICNNALEDTFSAIDVKEGYRNILMVLGKEDGVSQLSIANDTNLKPSTISIALKKMEHEGYISRVNDANDMRMSRVFLTEQGLEVANRAYDSGEEIGRILMDGISEAELQTVINVANKMKENYEKKLNK